MGYSQRELRNGRFALLERMERKIDQTRVKGIKEERLGYLNGEGKIKVLNKLNLLKNKRRDR